LGAVNVMEDYKVVEDVKLLVVAHKLSARNDVIRIFATVLLASTIYPKLSIIVAVKVPVGASVDGLVTP